MEYIIGTSILAEVAWIYSLPAPFSLDLADLENHGSGAAFEFLH